MTGNNNSRAISAPQAKLQTRQTCGESAKSNTPRTMAVAETACQCFLPPHPPKYLLSDEKVPHVAQPRRRLPWRVARRNCGSLTIGVGSPICCAARCCVAPRMCAAEPQRGLQKSNETHCGCPAPRLRELFGWRNETDNTNDERGRFGVAHPPAHSLSHHAQTHMTCPDKQNGRSAPCNTQHEPHVRNKVLDFHNSAADAFGQQAMRAQRSCPSKPCTRNP